MSNEAETCQEYVVPRLHEAGWDTAPRQIKEQYFFTDGRILVSGSTSTRRSRKFADYVLCNAVGFPIAVVEAKRSRRLPADGLQQAKDYAEILGLQFAYATNGHGIVEFDYTTGMECELDAFPTPDELWARLHGGTLDAEATRKLLAPVHDGALPPRYYQLIAINRAVEAVLRGKKRILLTLATGTGKTTIAFQIAWKLWTSGWNMRGAHNKPRILFLADRNKLIDDPKEKDFAPFGDARWKIEGGNISLGRQMYFAIYQALTALDENGQPLFRRFAPDFFDLIIVDECHRGSARDESSWRDILDYFAPAFKIGMTATPRRDDNIDTYAFFGNPIYEYSLKQGIDDGFLAPYRVHRVVLDVDATGYRPSPDDMDRYGRRIPDGEYTTKDFERIIALRKRTDVIARHLTNHLRTSDRFAKTIVFCVDQEHADAMRQALANLNSDLMRAYPDYACRVTANEGEIGMGHLDHFQDIERKTPVILTTSHLLTTGVNAQTVKNVVLARVVNSMTEFKQIIGRGTRVRERYGKTFFTILDYTGSATRQFADPAFDGSPALIIEEITNDTGAPESTTEYPIPEEQDHGEDRTTREKRDTAGNDEPRKYYFDGGQFQVAAELVFELDGAGRQINVTKLIDHTARQVRTLYRNTEEVRALWANPDTRNEVVQRLAERGVTFDELVKAAGQPDADPFDLLCHLAFNAPLLTRRERAEKLRKAKMDFFDSYGPQARTVLGDLLDKYAAHGTTQFVIPDALKVAPISERGNISEIAAFFGGAERLREAVTDMQRMLYLEN